MLVAAPLVSAGGVYTYLSELIPVLRAHHVVGITIGTRVPVADIVADATYRVSGITGLSGLSKLAREVSTGCLDFGPDLIVTFLPQADIAVAFSRRAQRVPWVAMVHGAPFPDVGEAPRLKRRVWAGLWKAAIKTAPEVVTVSQATATMIHHLGVQDPKVVHNGVLPRESFQRTASSQLVLGFVGRLSYEKGPDRFLKVVSQLSVRASVFGDGHLLDELRLESQSLDVTWHGWTPRERIYAQIDLLAVTSRREGLPLSILEAASFGTPFVGLDVGGVREIVAGNMQLERACVASDMDDLVRKARHLLDDAEARNAVAVALRGHVLKHFDRNRQFSLLDHLLRGAAAAPRLDVPLYARVFASGSAR